MMLEIPVLETARLVLRGHKIEDFEDAAAMWADPQVTRHIGGRAFSREESWARLLRYIGHWQLLGYGFWAVIEKASGRFVGEVGFADFKRDFDAPQDLELTGNHPEIGWALASAFHGKGFATEAVLAALGWGDRHLADTRTVCLIDPDNLTSRRVAEKAGYRELGNLTYKGNPIGLYGRDRIAPGVVQAVGH